MGNGNTELIKTDRNNLLVRRRTMLICVNQVKKKDGSTKKLNNEITHQPESFIPRRVHYQDPIIS